MSKGKTITITEEQLREAIQKAQEKWDAIGEGKFEQNPHTKFMMGLQNIMFGSLLEGVLFEESEDEE